MAKNLRIKENRPKYWIQEQNQYGYWNDSIGLDHRTTLAQAKSEARKWEKFCEESKDSVAAVRLIWREDTNVPF